MHASSVDPTEQASLEFGQVIDGRYTLKRLLATGGGAEVYAAEHRLTRQAVALKYPLDNTESMVRRTRREIDALAKVRGAGVVEMVDAAELNGRPYIVFHLLEGRTLAGLLTARGKLHVDHTVQVAVELCEALERCQAAGVIHRDVKPSNLFVTANADRQLVLLDFGIARIADDATQERITRDGSLLGTPEYMPPEALLSSADADHRVDIYSVGVVLYECLTGTVPFDGNYAEVLQKLSTRPPRPISEYRKDVPRQLEHIIIKCLSRAADDRYPSVGELLTDVRACSSPVKSAPRLLAGSSPAERETPGRAITIADSPVARRTPNRESLRKHVRAAYTTLARITLRGGAHVDGRLEEVSEGGLQFTGPRAGPVGEQATIRFGLPATGRIVDVVATARWNRTMRGMTATGFQFDELADAAREEIRRYVAIMSTNAESRDSTESSEASSH